MKKRILSIFLVVALMATMVPNFVVTAFAANYNTGYSNTYVNTGDYRKDIIGVAKTQLGYPETGSNSTKYGAWYGLNNEPWCAIFVSWCANQAGIPTSVIPKFAGCTSGGRAWFMERGRWRGANYTPSPGDLVFFDWDYSGDCDHVGIVEYVSGNEIHTIEGNTSNNIVERRTRTSSIAGYGIMDAQAAVSTSLSVSGIVAPQAIKQGSAFSIGGTVSSNARLNYVGIIVQNSKGEDIYWEQTGPGSTSFNLKNLDNNIRFGVLEPGIYLYQVEAQDDSGHFEVLTYQWFCVYEEPGDFYGYLIHNGGNWKHMENADGVVQVAKGGNDSFDPKQIWHYVPIANGKYAIYNCYDGTALTAQSTENSSSTKVTTSTYTGTDNQLWYIAGNNLMAAYTGLALDVPNNNPTAGAAVQLYTPNGGNAQLWSFYNISEQDHWTYARPAVPSGTTPTAAITQSNKSVKLSWSESPLRDSKLDARAYTLRVYNGSDTSGSMYIEKTGLTTTSYTQTFAPGTYTAKILAYNTKYKSYYGAGSNYTFTVYPDYTVTYNANNGSGAPGNQTKVHGTNLTLSSTKPTRSGYAFKNWNTKQDGSGTTYAAGASYTANANITLYAIWEETASHAPVGTLDNVFAFSNRIIVWGWTYDPDDVAQSLEVQVYVDSALVGKTIANQSRKDVDDAYPGVGAYHGYNCTLNTTVKAGQVITVEAVNIGRGDDFKTIGRFTVDKIYPATFTVIFDPNGGSTSTANKKAAYAEEYGSLPVPTRTGYTFVGWYTSASGGNKVESTTKYDHLQDTTLYAHWTLNNYTVTYNANGGSNAPECQSKTHDVALTLSSTEPTRPDYVFKGWNTKADGSGTSYAPGANYTANENVSLYAIWEPDPDHLPKGVLDECTVFNDYITVRGWTYDPDDYSQSLEIEVYLDSQFIGKATANVTRADVNEHYGVGNYHGYQATFEATAKAGQKLSVKAINIGGGVEDKVLAVQTVTEIHPSNRFTLIFNPNGGMIDTSSKEVVYGEKYGSLPIPVWNGYSFDGWFTAATGGNRIDDNNTVRILQNITLYAQWTKIESSAIEPVITIPGASNAGIIVTAPEGGWQEGENTFSVACASPCVAMVSYDNGVTYQRLNATVTDGGASYTVENLTDDIILTVSLAGDANSDGKLTNADVTRLQAITLKKVQPTPLQAVLLDVNKDGKLTNADKTRLRAVQLKKTQLGW